VVNDLLEGFGTVSVIDRSSHAVVKNITVGEFPWSVAITPNGKRVYVTNSIDGTVSVIDTTTLSVVYTTPVIAGQTFGLAVTPNGKYVYVMGGSVALVMDTATNAITTTIPMPSAAWVAITPNGRFAYVTDVDYDTVRVINTTTNTIAKTIPGASCTTLGVPICYATGVAIGPFGRYAYATSHGDRVFVIDTFINAVVDTITVGMAPVGIAVRPLP
jgi:YVTN family beta-propeller protein